MMMVFAIDIAGEPAGKGSATEKDIALVGDEGSGGLEMSEKVGRKGVRNAEGNIELGEELGIGTVLTPFPKVTVQLHRRLEKSV